MNDASASTVEQIKQVRQGQILNRLNALNYQSSPILVCLQHKVHGHYVYLKATSDPVSDEQASATWIKEVQFPPSFESYLLIKVILSSRYGAYEFTPAKYHLGEQEFTFVIPESASESDFRKQQRYLCATQDNTVTLFQNAAIYMGCLEDFSTSGVLIRLTEDPGSSLTWINPELPAMLTISGASGSVYTGQVNIVPREKNFYLLKPSSDAAPRYTAKPVRARRQNMCPAPNLTFTHPVLGRRFSLKTKDVGSLGFSVTEKKARASLIPGLLIRDIEVTFAANALIHCTAQVVYCRPDEEDPTRVCVGLAILDISIEDHLRLVNIVQQVQDSQTYIGNETPTEELFEFFFETGFIYPNKYVDIAGNRQELSKTYTALYEKGSDISRHFVYQEDGEILGHFSALRVYDKTWLYQHHAALKNKRAGLKVLRAASEFINDCYQLKAANKHYILGYYQPTKRFPRNFLGRFTEKTNDKIISSVDTVAYISEARQFRTPTSGLAGGWALRPSFESDIAEFYHFYKKAYGGIMPEALSLSPENFDFKSISDAYAKNSLTRTRILRTLTLSNSPKALFDIQKTDFGLNLSEVTNAIYVYMIDPQPDYYAAVSSAIYQLALEFEKMSLPVMIFPNTYAADCRINYDKEYVTWVMDATKAMPEYMPWVDRCCR